MDDEIRLRVVFYKTEAGSEPVRAWLKSLSREDRKVIGEDIKTVHFDGLLVCHWFANWKAPCGKFAPSYTTELHEPFSLLRMG